MTIWILTLVLLASLAGLGYRQGVVRVAFSLVGILVAAMLALPLGHLVRPVFSAIGLKNPILLWMLPPFVMYCVVLALFKVAGLAAHRKADVYYKYRAGELRYTLWERLSRRAGLCLGLVNALAYLVLISFVVYTLSYWTVQLSGPDSGSMVINLLNRMGKDLESTGMVKVARSVEKMPAAYYEAADIAGTVYHNYSPRLANRVAGYPALLGVGERPELQALGSDADFIGLWQRKAPLMELLRNPKANAVLKSPDALKALWAAAKPNLQDFQNFLHTGESATYTEKILGRWSFDVNGALAAMRRNKPGISPAQLVAQRNWMNASLGKASFVATPQQEALLKNIVLSKASTPGAMPVVQVQNYQGSWKGTDGKYEVTINTDKTEQSPIEFQGDRLSFTLGSITYVFAREN
jgi:hypothetical protein